MIKNNTKPTRILLVDDDPVQVKLLQTRLKENGFEVLTAHDAAVGLQLAIDQTPEIVILDVMMPIINGYNFCRLVKTEVKVKDISVILLTSRDKLEDIRIGLEMGADAYLVKPVNIEELLRAIKVVGSSNHKH